MFECVARPFGRTKVLAARSLAANRRGKLFTLS